MTTTARPETRLKAAVIDRLFEASHVDSDSVLVSEMVVDNWSRRADLVLANGKLWAFEIKSESDKLARLPGQLASFAYHFEKFVVVVAARFEEPVRKMIPEGVGLWVEERPGVLVERVRPRTMAMAKEASIALMTAVELRSLLACNGVANLKDVPRLRLEELARDLPISDLANAARNAIKRRHRKRHADFVKRRAAVDTCRAMRTLRKFGKRNVESTMEEPYVIALPPVHIAEDHPLFVRAPAGAVLKRRVV
ncbi:MAG: sce7726 family protein [Variibacter sp.]